MSTFEPPHIYDLVDPDALQYLFEQGYVREAAHPTGHLALLNYTDRAQCRPEVFEEFPSLNLCRGLIYNTADGTVVARPFAKFWNYGQSQAAPIEANDHVQVHEKIDGSLGILYREPSTGYPAIATRGSFDSEQARHATKLIRTKYGEWAEKKLALGETLLFEIVYPENRIVLDYGDQDDLVLLGAVDIRYGAVSGPATAWGDYNWPGPVAETWFGGTFAEALAMPLDRPNAEGYVIRVIKSAPSRAGNMVKLKQADYLELHRIVFGLSTRRIYEAVVAGRTLEQILEPLPDEFHAWTTAVYNELYAKFRKRHARLNEQYATTMAWAHKGGMCGLYEDESGYEWTVDRSERKEIAQLFSELDDPWAMFALLDDRDIAPKIWKELEPPAGQLPSSYEPKEA